MALTNLIETGRITPAIDSVYPLAEVPAALRRFGQGHLRGKLAIRVAGG